MCMVWGANADDTKITDNTVLVNDEGEPFIAINPSDPNKMVLGFMKLPNSGFDIYTSDNGGDTWEKSSFDPNDKLAEDFPGYNLSGHGDIVFAYDKDGDTLYGTWLYTLADNQLDTALFAGYFGVSTDNGRTFTFQEGDDGFYGLGKMDFDTTSIVYEYKDGFCDRQWMAVDRTNGPYQNNLYIGYVNFAPGGSESHMKVKTKEAGSNTLSEAVTAYFSVGQFTNLKVDGQGVLHYTFCNFNTDRVHHVSSSDGGQTFDQIHIVHRGDILAPRSVGGATAFINERENAAVSLAIDRKDYLHLVWSDFPDGEFPNSYYSRSTDGGATWSTPLDLSTEFGDNTYMPNITSYEDRISITAFVMDNSKTGDYYVLPSGDNGDTFLDPIKVSSAQTNLTFFKDNFIGDYNTSVRTRCDVYSAYTDCRANGCKLYVSKIDECAITSVQELTPLSANFSLNKYYPSPAIDQLTIDIDMTENNTLSVEVYDLEGKQVYRGSQQVVKGNNIFTVGLSDVAAGSYLLKLVNEQEVFVTRLFTKQ